MAAQEETPKRTAGQAAEELLGKLTDAQRALVTTKDGAGDYVIVKAKGGGTIASVRPRSVKVTIPTADDKSLAAAAKVLGSIAAQVAKEGDGPAD